MDTVPRCGACHWWQQHDIEADYQRSDDARLWRGWGLCRLTKSFRNVPLRPAVGAFASTECYDLDEDQDRAVLVTAPDFGCILWQAKQSSEAER
jgi:hypothetical protein